MYKKKYIAQTTGFMDRQYTLNIIYHTMCCMLLFYIDKTRIFLSNSRRKLLIENELFNIHKEYLLKIFVHTSQSVILYKIYIL